MHRCYLILLLSLFFFAACGEKNTNEGAASTQGTETATVPDSIKAYKANALSNTQMHIQDKLFEKVMFVHDDAMPLMGEMNKISRTLRKAADGKSLGSGQQEEARGIAYQLDTASEAMMAWMADVGENNLGKLRETMDHAQIMGVLDQQLADITTINQDMKSSLEAGRGILVKLGLK